MQTAHLTIDDSPTITSLKQLTYFLTLFRAAYAVGRQVDDNVIDDVVSHPGYAHVYLRNQFVVSHSGRLDDLFATSLGTDEPLILEIHKESPLEIAMAASIPLL